MVLTVQFWARDQPEAEVLFRYLLDRHPVAYLKARKYRRRFISTEDTMNRMHPRDFKSRPAPGWEYRHDRDRFQVQR
jgi:hypothetical protein